MSLFDSIRKKMGGSASSGAGRSGTKGGRTGHYENIGRARAFVPDRQPDQLREASPRPRLRSMTPAAQGAPKLIWSEGPGGTARDWYPSSLWSIARWALEGYYRIDSIADLYGLQRNLLRRACNEVRAYESIKHGDVADNGFAAWYEKDADTAWFARCLDRGSITSMDIARTCGLKDAGAVLSAAGKAASLPPVKPPRHAGGAPGRSRSEMPLSTETGGPIDPATLHRAPAQRLIRYRPRPGAPEIVWLEASNNPAEKDYMPKSVYTSIAWSRFVGMGQQELQEALGMRQPVMKRWMRDFDEFGSDLIQTHDLGDGQFRYRYPPKVDIDAEWIQRALDAGVSLHDVAAIYGAFEDEIEDELAWYEERSKKEG